METMLLVVALLVGVFALFKVLGEFSLKGRTISTAMKALRNNVHVVPDDSTEYFPTTSVMKATLRQSYDLAGVDRAVSATPADSSKVGANLLLDYVGHLFERDSQPHMAKWCFASKDSLDVQQAG